jgi:general secretion pathway protein C
MVTNLQSRWAVAGATFILWALVAGSAVFWGLKMSARSAVVPTAPVAGCSPVAADPAAVAKLLGAGPATAGTAPAAPSLASRLALVGVVASATQHGAALISIDGKPAKPFRVGSTIEEGLVLQSVQARRATLGANANGPSAVTLELPARK